VTSFAATATAPGPDGNAAHAWPTAAVLELRDAQAVGRPYRYLEGRAVPYDTWADIGWFVESHAAGSFKKSTREAAKAAPLLLFHDHSRFPVGHAERWAHEDDGLHGVWRLNDRAEAQQAAVLAESGDLVGLSIGFQPIRSDWALVDDWNPDLGQDHKDRVLRTESRLLEVSLTPTPAFAEAMVTEVRAALAYTRAARQVFLGPRAVDHWRAEVERLRSA
jgi:HK97 family phage prohead protease